LVETLEMILVVKLDFQKVEEMVAMTAMQ
jgi:hypothetical protein